MCVWLETVFAGCCGEVDGWGRETNDYATGIAAMCANVRRLLRYGIKGKKYKFVGRGCKRKANWEYICPGLHLEPCCPTLSSTLAM